MNLRFVACALALTGLLAPTAAAQDADSGKATAVGLRRCLVDARPNAVQVLIGGFAWSSRSAAAPPDVWTYNNDCTVKQEPGLFVSAVRDADVIRADWNEAKKIVAGVKALLQKDRARPVVLIGHSFGGGALPLVARQLQDEKIGVDLVIAIDAVHSRKFLSSDTLTLPSTVAAVAHVRAEKQERVPAVSKVENAVEYVIGGTTHTDVDAAAECYAIVQHLMSKLPARGINSAGGLATPKDYAAVRPPRTLDEFPAAVRQKWKRQVKIVLPGK
jgi:triacylglycerol esterase/lipase EstA (alpha/beta hydrolase family)